MKTPPNFAVQKLDFAMLIQSKAVNIRARVNVKSKMAGSRCL